jgi:predicted ribosomally synthesized peptide with nif11-like leader
VKQHEPVPLEEDFMSKDAVIRLLEMVSQDEELERSLQAAVEERGDLTAAIVEFAGEHGHSFAAEELIDVLEKAREAQGELSLDELEQVAGGLGPQPEPPDRQRDNRRGLSVRVPPWLMR